MHIIGKTSGGYITEITGDELSLLCGFAWSGSSDFREYLKQTAKLDGYGNLQLPAEVPVSNWWRRLEGIRQKERDLEKMAETLRGLADLIGNAWPAIQNELPSKEADR